MTKSFFSLCNSVCVVCQASKGGVPLLTCWKRPGKTKFREMRNVARTDFNPLLLAAQSIHAVPFHLYDGLETRCCYEWRKCNLLGLLAEKVELPLEEGVEFEAEIHGWI